MAEWSRAITWRRISGGDREGAGLEHLLLREGIADSVVLAFDEHGHRFRLAYRLTWDEAWRLRDGAGRALSALDGCLDIDIWPTPFTNTFPIRRQPMAIGERRELVVAWVAAPELTVRPVRQRYTRLAERRYLFENLDGDGFHAELPVDEDAVVLDYEGLFRRVS